MAIMLSPEQEKAALAQIRNSDPEAVKLQAQLEIKKNEELMANAKRLDEIRLKVNSGATLSSEEEKFIKDQESGKPAEESGAEAGGSGEAKLTEEQQMVVDELDTLTAKIEKGDATDEEIDRARELASQPVIQDKVFKIGGKEFKTSELFQKWCKESNLDPTDISESAIPKIVENYATSLNKKEWESAGQRRDQQAAKERRRVGEVSLRLLEANEQLKNDLNRAEALIQKTNEIAKRTLPTSIKDENNEIDPMKQREFNKILDARESLTELQKEHELLKERSIQMERTLATQQFRDFQEEHPQYRTSQDIAALAADMGTGRISSEDELKIREMFRIFQGARDSRSTPEREYEYLASLGTLAIKPSNNGADRKVDDPSRFQRLSDKEQLLQNLKRKRDAAVSLAPGKPTGQRQVTDTKKAHAQNIRASSQSMITGGQSVDTKLAEAGY